MFQFFTNAENFISAVQTVIRLLYFGGAILLLDEEIEELWYVIRLKLKERQNALSEIEENNFSKLFDRFIRSTMGNSFSAGSFWEITATIFFITFIVISRFSTYFASFILGAIIASVPLILLKLRLERSRTKSSYEAEALISKLAIQYGIFQNIEDAIQAVIGDDELPVTSPMLYDLLLKLRSTRNQKALKEATEMFAYQVGTNWSIMLAHNIYAASYNHVNITHSLDDIIVQLREARNLTEERKRINAESGRMFYLIPLFYIGSVFMGMNFAGMTFSDFLSNQFSTVPGFICFLIFIGMTILSYLLIATSKNQKFDF